MSARTLDPLCAEVVTSLDALARGIRRELAAAERLIADARVERAELVRELDAEQPTCRTCHAELPSKWSLDALEGLGVPVRQLLGEERLLAMSLSPPRCSARCAGANEGTNVIPMTGRTP